MNGWLLILLVLSFQPLQPGPSPVAFDLGVQMSVPPAGAPFAALLFPPAEPTAACFATATGRINLRSGPDITFDRVGGLQPGQTLGISAQAQGSDGFVWWRLENDAFARSDTVTLSGDCDEIPSAAER
jgi:hypothetical protein